MPGLPRPRVDKARVKPMRARKRPSETGGVAGREDEMHVVGHQAIGPHRNVEFPARLRQPVPVQFIVRIFEENALAPVAALGDVMRRTRDDDASDAGHARSIAGN
jgi:hypothetical protein